jgi:hypothetical protein
LIGWLLWDDWRQQVGKKPWKLIYSRIDTNEAGGRKNGLYFCRD